MDLREKYKDNFTEDSVSQIEKMERELLYRSHFSIEDALKLGIRVIECAKDYHESIAVRIIRMSDLLPVFQYVGEGLKERNLNFAMRKYNTVIRTGHCSMWALAKACTEGWEDDLFCEDSGCLPAGGAFPVYVGKEMKAVVAVSGLHHGGDYKVVIQAMCQEWEKAIPYYDGIPV